ncbi:eukaryotic integral membrane protein-domain-containing protein [Chytriomyces sp. MP71]|nr:eukaryotic integral membrane protein-domain-containing protein [Chytriomyces sp. MP71]
MAALSTIASSIGIGTKAALASAVLLSFVSLVAKAGLKGSESGWNRPFEVIPGFLLSRPWTYFTAGFVEVNLALLPLSLIGVLLSGRYFEKIWGPREFLKFIAIVSISSVILTAFTLLFEFISTQDVDKLYATHVGGMLALLSGFLVAFKQAVPEHSLNVAGVVSVRVKRLPSVAILMFLVLMIFRVVHVEALMVIYGSVVAWFYIRFFKFVDGIQGDRAESFSFASFFPASTHRVIMPISNSTFNLFVSLNLLPKLGPLPLPSYSDSPVSATAAAPQMRSSTPQPLPGSDAAEAERRRAIALKALDMRLSESTGGAGVNPASGGSAAGTPVRGATPARVATPARFGDGGPASDPVNA